MKMMENSTVSLFFLYFFLKPLVHQGEPELGRYKVAEEKCRPTNLKEKMSN